MRRIMPALLFAVALAVVCLSASAHAQQADKPNILIFLADDLGIECLSTYGGLSHTTPNLDKLAAQGMVFNNCFSNPYCSPSRASLLTGRYPFQNGIREVIYDLNLHSDLYLHTDQPSFARQLKQAGYATAIAGKWQLSFLHQRDTVNDFGFGQYQCWQIFNAAGERTRRYHEPHFKRNGTVIAEQIKDRYGPDVDAEFLIDFIRQNAKENKPFLAYYTCLLPHFPWVPTPDSEDKSYVLAENKSNSKGDPKYFPDMVAYVDKQVGQLMQALDDAGVADNTVLIFLADNGTDRDLTHRWGDGEGQPVQGGKGTMTDRGTHVPLMVRWPGHVKAGTRCDDLIDFSDLFPTLCEIGGAPLPEASIHGRSFLPQLTGQAGHPRQWVHVQDKSSRHIRSSGFILNNKGEFRPVVGIADAEAPPITSELSPRERAERALLQQAFDDLATPAKKPVSE